RLRVAGPEVPLHVVIAQAGVWQALLAADEVRELHRVAHEEDRRVVSDQGVVAFVRIELQREAAYVAPGVGTAGLTCDGRKARQHVGASAFPEEGRPGVSRNVLGSFEYAERASAFRMRLTLGHFLAVEVRHLFEEMDVMQDDRAISTN